MDLVWRRDIQFDLLFVQIQQTLKVCYPSHLVIEIHIQQEFFFLKRLLHTFPQFVEQQHGIHQ